MWHTLKNGRQSINGRDGEQLKRRCCQSNKRKKGRAVNWQGRHLFVGQTQRGMPLVLPVPANIQTSVKELKKRTRNPPLIKSACTENWDNQRRR
ncbi:hypothetical protein OUZ56_008649 [Daphnia magna]|uniref:Uncharacterized protein n=1 Tax=Daphnia magna TaxID=35525 RepID=A0ABR0ADM3_9CRUS|nr:hypothetical protein OUZ56_008649 [Daphnia magna]